MKPKTLTLLILTGMVIASVACGTSGFDTGYQEGYGNGHTTGLAEGKQALAEYKQKSIATSEKVRKSGYDKGYAEGRKVGQQEGWDAHIAELKNPQKTKITDSYNVPGSLDRNDAKNLAIIHLQSQYPSGREGGVVVVDGNYEYLEDIDCRLYGNTNFEYYDTTNNTWHFKTGPSTEPECKRPKVVKVLVNDKTQETSFQPAQDLQQPQQTTEALTVKTKAGMLQKQGRASSDNGNHAKAIELYSQAIELWPNWSMHFNRGVAYGESGNSLEACKDYKIAYKSKGEMNADTLKSLEDNMKIDNC